MLITRPERKHNQALDGVRGLAILLVLIHHGLLPARADTRIGQALMPLTQSCWIGVDLFFALSGFLITGILVDTLGSTHYLRNFYARRALRIFPLYYAVLVCVLLAELLMGVPFGPGSGLRRMMLPLTLYLQNTGLWTPLDHYVVYPFTLNHFWSLAVEEQFYLIWPLLLFWIRQPAKLLRLALMLSVCAFLVRVWLTLIGASPWFVYSFTACRADTLLLGASLALLLRMNSAAARLAIRRYAPPIGALAFLLVLGFSFRGGGLDWYADWKLRTIGFTLTAIAACGLLASTQGDAPRFLSWRWLRFLGKYSYGLYVLHRLFTATLIHAFSHGLQRYLHNRMAAEATGWALGWTFTMLLTMGSFRYFETPFLRLKRLFEPTRTVALR